VKARGLPILTIGAIIFVGAAPAHAELGPIQMISANAHEQADSATLPAMSGTGRYVAFRATLSGVSGVFRRDLQTGALELVAGGSAYNDVPVEERAANDATAPSISADGRYVAFTTSAALDPADDGNSAPDVYVRDMSEPLPPGGACPGAGPCAFEVASAADGSTSALGGGARSAPGAALSADGRHVAFVTIGESELTSGADGSTPGIATPAGQVVLRDLDEDATTLVSTARDPITGTMTALPVPGGAVLAGAGASLSADGTTVAWAGVNIPAQAPTLSDEPALMAGEPSYNEPLWRRVADGPQASTRRVVGGGDPLAAGCPPGGTFATAACNGPYPRLFESNELALGGQAGWLPPILMADSSPHLSRDGRLVALVGAPTLTSNLFLVDMADGLDRVQAVHQITFEGLPLPRRTLAKPSSDMTLNANVLDAAISADGRWLAFTTQRQQFPLAPATLVSQPPSTLGEPELYRFDRETATIQRVTPGSGDGPSVAADTGRGGVSVRGAETPSLSADGETAAFGDLAYNLVGGDGNGASDIFVVSDHETPRQPGSVSISPAPAPRSFTPEWRMAVRASSNTNGTVRVAITTPGSGMIRVSASADVVTRKLVRVRVRARTRGRRATVTRRRWRSDVVSRRVATATKPVARADTAVLTLRLSSRYRALAAARGGLPAALAVSFSAHQQPTLKDALAVRFRRAATRAARRHRASSTKRPRTERR
jgi:Tol biopolymer transport system component